MPNIIEQQDLLKGLPDNKLAMMMQQPTGDMPPFLVAAEAQRRQSIREQFSGGPQESVVDTLTKQLAGSVPQNIQAPAQTPPQMPPPQMPPQMAGVGALPSGEGMRRGGVVQRYQAAGLVTPSIYSPSTSGNEQMARTYMMLNPGMTYEEALQRSSIGGALPIPKVGDVEAARAGKTEEGIGGVGNYSILRRNMNAPSTGQITEQSAGVQPTPSELSTENSRTTLPYDYSMPGERHGIFPPKPQTANPTVQTRDESSGQKDTSLENMAASRYAAMKKHAEEIYGEEAVSDWERAQKWFDTAQAIMEPGQSKGQVIVNALSAFGSGAARERAAERAASLSQKKAMFDIDLARMAEAEKTAREERDYQRSVSGAAHEEKIDLYKFNAEQAREDAALYRKAADDGASELRVRISQMTNQGASDDMIAKDPQVIALTKQIKDDNERMSKSVLRSRNFQTLLSNASGAGRPVEYADGTSMGTYD